MNEQINPENEMFLPWLFATNGYMNDAFREHVARIAWVHLPDASPDLRTHARRVIQRDLKVNGFRPGSNRVLRAAWTIVRQDLVLAFKTSSDVSAALISLWAEANAALIQRLRAAAADEGIYFKSNWTWQEASEGFLQFEAIQELDAIAESINTDNELTEWELRLAALWLSNAHIETPEPELEDAATTTKAIPTESETTEIPSEIIEAEALIITDTPEAQSIPATPITTLDLELNLSAVYDALEKGEQHYTQSADMVNARMEALNRHIKQVDIKRAQDVIQELPNLLMEWRAVRGQINKVIVTSRDFMQQELNTRPDLIPNGDIHPHATPDAQANYWMNVAREIVSYDEQKINLRATITAQVDENARLQQEIFILVPDDNPAVMDDLNILDASDDTLTLSELQTSLQTLRNQQKILSEQIQTQRQHIIGSIQSLLGELEQTGITPDQVVLANGQSLTEISKHLEAWSSTELSELEAYIKGRLQNEREKQSAPQVEALYGLRDNWNTLTLIDTMRYLASEKRHIEMFLLLVQASINQPEGETLVLDDTMMASVFHGAGQLSQGQPFRLLNRLLPLLLTAISVQDPIAQARLALMTLGADYDSKQRIGQGYLWQLQITMWPLSEMTTWASLWDAALTQETLPDFVTADTVDPLKQAHDDAALLLTADKGLYPRVQNIKNPYHRNLLNKTLLPKVEAWFQQLVQIETAVHRMRGGANYNQKLEKAHTALVERKDSLRNYMDRLDAIYDAASSAANVQDRTPFHRRVSVGLFADAVTATHDYANALLIHVELQGQTATLDRDQLLAETAAVPALDSLARQVITQIEHLEDKHTLPAWNYDYAMDEMQHLLTYGVLHWAEVALTLPRLVAGLVNERIRVESWLPYLLDDFETPPGPEEAANLLLTENVTEQLLPLLTRLPTHLQTTIQTRNAEQAAQINQLENDLLRLGGESDDLNIAREAGRWGYLRSELQTRIDQYKSQQSTSSENQREHSIGLLTAIHQAENAVFIGSSTIPLDICNLVYEGLSLARRATLEMRLHDAVKEYLNEINYRLDHDAWPLDEIRASLNALNNAYENIEIDRTRSYSSAQVLELLERGELRSLGLGTDTVIETEINTRIDLLTSWADVRQLTAFKTTDLPALGQENIRRLAQHFRQMVQMAYEYDQNNEPMEYDDPVPYSHRRLIYPRTSALDAPVILLTLPGEPPKASHVRDLEMLLDDRGWLDDYFVIVFIPGGTDALRQRLMDNFRGRGLVVIDDATMVSLVLAERNGIKPLGRLRALMLNTNAVENLEIFKTNQLVDNRTAIFVGRDPLIKRLVSSSENFALYGGRRIGKSSILLALKERLEARNNTVILHSFEATQISSDNISATRLAQLIDPTSRVRTVTDLEDMLRNRLEANKSLRLVFLLDEIDLYIRANPKRNLLIESMRKLSDYYKGRLRVIAAGFMFLFDFMHGRGPYTAANDPWNRMFNGHNVSNLTSASAERIAREGFQEILGWSFETRAIPRRIVEYTGGHPAFVQKFCSKLRERTARRHDTIVRLEDVEAVFEDTDPTQSFIAYVQQTLNHNLDPVGHYVTVWLATEAAGTHTFTMDQIRYYADLSPTTIPQEVLIRSVEQLQATNVVRQRQHGIYEFSVPDYPKILKRMGDTKLLNRLEARITELLGDESA